MPGTNRTLRCGCRICGCICAEHSDDGVERLCAPHVDRAVFRFVIDEGHRLVVMALFVGIVAIAAAVLSI